MDGVYKLTAFLHNRKGHHWENVFNYSVVGSAPSDSKFATALALADAWEAKMRVDFLLCMGADTTLDVVAATCIDPPPGTTATSIVGLDSTSADDGSSSALAVDVKWIDGGDTGRFTRTFVANPPFSAIQGDNIDPALITKIDAWALLMIAELALGGGKGNASFVHYVKKTKDRHAVVVADVADKVTGLNKRTVPNL